MRLHPQLKETEKVSLTLIDQLTGIKNDISDIKALVFILCNYFDDAILNNSNVTLGTEYNEYGVLNETIAEKLTELEIELNDLVDNKLIVKK